MDDHQMKRSALMSAYLRGYHSVHDIPKIFDDLLAHRMVTEEERAVFEQALVTTLQSIYPERAESLPDRAASLAYTIQALFPTSLFLSRSRYAEESLMKALKQGVKQYVILGAGMDTFAFRHPEVVKQIKVFEVDHPATQAFKRRRLAELGLVIPENLHFVPVDFTNENLETALKRSSYDSQSLCFFSWLGVIHYLPRGVVFNTLRTISEISPARSILTFDYWDTDAFVAKRAAKRVTLMQEMVRRAGEPMKTGLDPATLAKELQNLGLLVQEHLSPSDIQERYFRGRKDGYYAYEHSHFVSVMVE